MKQLLLALLLSFVSTGFVFAQDITTTVTATGRTTGHIANIIIQNNGNKAVNLQIPAAKIASDGQHQGFAVTPSGQYTVPGNSSLTVAIEGFCTSVNLPAPLSGSVLQPMNEWDTESPLASTIQEIIETIKTMQKSGAISTGLGTNPENELSVLTQEIIWVLTAPPDQPYGASEYCISMKQQYETTTGTPLSSIPEGFGYGTAQIWDAVKKVGKQLSIPAFTPPSLATTVAELPVALPSNNPAVTNTIKVVGTGRTTGYIATLTVSNPTKYPVNLQFGPITPMPGGAIVPWRAIYVPSDGNHQPYIIIFIPIISLAPGETKTIELKGYCVNIRRPPVPAGADFPPVEVWVAAPEPMNPPNGSVPPTAPEPMNPPGASGPPSVPEPMNPPNGSVPPTAPEPMNPPGASGPPSVPEPMNPPNGYVPPTAPEPMNPPGASGPPSVPEPMNPPNGSVPPTAPEPMNPPGASGPPSVPEPMNPPNGSVPPTAPEPMNPPGASGPPSVPEPMNPPNGSVPQTVIVPTRTALPLSEVVTMLTSMAAAENNPDCTSIVFSASPLIPGTNTPIPVPINPDEHPGVATPLLQHAIGSISNAFDQKKAKNQIKTKFSKNPAKEREAAIQQVFWQYTAALEGDPYEKKDFRDITIRQYEQKTGKSFDKAPKEQQEQMDGGVDEFWDVFEGVGAEAKIIVVPEDPPASNPTVEDYFNNLSPVKGPFSEPGTGDMDDLTTEPGEPPVLIADRRTKKECDCGDISFELQVWDANEVAPRQWSGIQGTMLSKNVKISSNPGLAAHEIKIGKKGLVKGSAQIVSIKNMAMDCPCIEITKAVKDAVKELEKLEKSSKTKLERAINDLATAEEKLTKERAKRNPRQSTIDRLKEDVVTATTDRDALQNAIEEKKTALNTLKTNAKLSDCPVFDNSDKEKSNLPNIAVKEGNNPVAGRWGKETDPPNKDYYNFTLIKGNNLMEFNIEFSFYCDGGECKPVACKRIVVVKVDE